jgi:hypothetical protein
LLPVCLVPDDFSAIPVSISAVSVRRLSTYILYAKWAVSSLGAREDCKEFKMYRKGKDIRKKRHNTFKLPNLCGNQFINT